jgi:hypothetical protein
MDITIETARELREAFGPCSAVYECMTPEEIVARIAEHGTTREWIKLELDVEEIRADRQCFDGPEPLHEWRRTEKEIRKRLKEIGYIRLS